MCCICLTKSTETSRGISLNLFYACDLIQAVSPNKETKQRRNKEKVEDYKLV
jgi:hypothetical protein